MAYKVIILYQLYMPSYFLGTFNEYPYTIHLSGLTYPTRKYAESKKTGQKVRPGIPSGSL